MQQLHELQASLKTIFGLLGMPSQQQHDITKMKKIHLLAAQQIVPTKHADVWNTTGTKTALTPQKLLAEHNFGTFYARWKS